MYCEKGENLTGEGTNYIYLGKKLIAKYGDVTPTSTAESRQHYRPYGESIEGAKEDIGYTGHKFDKELGLSYMQARYYDPVIGRFYSNDPVDTLGHIGSDNPVHGFNRYAYANNNPYKYVDPDGELPIAAWIIGGALGAVTEYATQVGKNLMNQQSLGEALTNVDGKGIAASTLAGAVGANGVKLLKSAMSGTTKAGKVDSKAARAVMAVDGAAKAGSAGAIKGATTGSDPGVEAVKNVVDSVSPIPIADTIESAIEGKGIFEGNESE